MSKDKQYVFYLHYNKTASNKNRKPQITVHYRNVKYTVNNIHCNTVIFSVVKEYEPKCILKGKVNNFNVMDNVAYMSNTNADSDVSYKNSGYRVTFFYNKPESSRAGKTQITLIYRGKTYHVDNIVCNIPIHSETKKMEFTLNGRCKEMKIEKNVAYLN